MLFNMVIGAVNRIANVAYYPIKQFKVGTARKKVYPQLLIARKGLNATRVAIAIATAQESSARVAKMREWHEERMRNLAAEHNGYADACNDFAKLLHEVKADIVLFAPKEQQEGQFAAQVTA
jgi:hypothetical protein